MMGFKYLGNKVWNRYKKIISGFLDNDSGRQHIIWAHKMDQLRPFGEDSQPGYHLRTIEALCLYNAFRNWPINRETTTGELDDENLSIIISKNYLESRGYLDKHGYIDFNWSEDRFIINGIQYKPSGDTQVAQAKDEAVAFLIILKRNKESDGLTNIVNAVRDKNNSIVYTTTEKDIYDIVITAKH